MKILAFDSTARAASCALVDDGKLLGHYNIDNGLTQSELLLPMAEDMLRSLGLTFDDVDAYAAATGPGSFTGVRIGVSLVKGLAFGKNKPCISVSTLEALAENIAALDGILLPCMDARRAQVYNAVFSSDGNALTRLTEDRAIALCALESELAEKYGDKKIYLCGDGYDVAAKGMNIAFCSTPVLLREQNAYSVAVAAMARYNSCPEGAYTDRDVMPTYLRVPQAERERLERILQQ